MTQLPGHLAPPDDDSALITDLALAVAGVKPLEDVQANHGLVDSDLDRLLDCKATSRRVVAELDTMRRDGRLIEAKASQLLESVMLRLGALADNPDVSAYQTIKLTELLRDLSGHKAKVESRVKATNGGNEDRFSITINMHPRGGEDNAVTIIDVPVNEIGMPEAAEV